MNIEIFTSAILSKMSDITFSMADAKAQYNNELMVNTFISTFGIDPNQAENKIKIQKLYQLGKIAA